MSKNGEIVQALRNLGLESTSICLHSSLRSFSERRVIPDEVIRSFLELDNTILVPTQSWLLYSAPKPESRGFIPFNAEDDGSIPSSLPSEGFSIASNKVGKAMGALPQTLLQDPKRRRGNHPLASFAALGQKADSLIQDQNFASPLLPLEKLRQLDGYVMLMGVGLTSATALHLAEQLAGLPGLTRWALLESKEIVECSVTGCSKGFNSLINALGHLSQQQTVLGSAWTLYPLKTLLDDAVEVFLEDPLIATCDVHSCPRCSARFDYVRLGKTRL